MDVNDPRIPVGMEIDRVIERFGTFEETSATAMDSLVEKLQEMQNELEESKIIIEVFVLKCCLC